MNTNKMNNPIFKIMKQEINQEIRVNMENQQDPINQISLQTKIKINQDKQYWVLNLGNKSFLIYTENEIFLFNKNLNYKKLFSFHEYDKAIRLFQLMKNNYKYEIPVNSIVFIKHMNKGKFLFLFNNDLYICNINSKTKIIKFEKNQIVLDAIELKNGIILTITKNDILNIKINENKYEISKLCKTPEHNECKLSIYELPKNNILISSIFIETYEICDGCIRHSRYNFITKEIIFNLDKCEIIKSLNNCRNNYFNNYKIIIYNKYICVSKDEFIYIYNISDYDFIKAINVSNYNIIKYDENMFLVKDDYNDFLTLYDITNINNIKYQKLYYNRIKNGNKNFNLMLKYGMMLPEKIDFVDIIKISEGKMVFILYDNIYIVKYIKHLQLLTPKMQQQIEVKPIVVKQIKKEKTSDINKFEPMKNNNSDNGFINIIFDNNKIKISIQIHINEKVSNLIQKYKSKSCDFNNKKIFIYNAKALNPSLSCKEVRLTNNAIVHIINKKVLEGALYLIIKNIL